MGIVIEKFRRIQKENLLKHFVGMLDKSGKVLHTRKLLKDLINRERQASTGLENGIAIPHVRSRYVRDALVGFARSYEGCEFGALDGKPSHLFFIIVSPSSIGDLHIKIYKQIAEMFTFSDAYDQLMEVYKEGEVIRILKQFD